MIGKFTVLCGSGLGTCSELVVAQRKPASSAGALIRNWEKLGSDPYFPDPYFPYFPGIIVSRSIAMERALDFRVPQRLRQ